MVSRCEHCGQTVMATDDQCWHCGKQLATNKTKSARRPHSQTAVPDDTISLPSFYTILLYAGLTAVALLILIGTTRAIGQAPLFLVNRKNLPQAGWQPITDSHLQFTLNLPKTWHAIEMDRAPEALELRSSPPMQALGDTFAALVADTELLFLGTEDTAVFPDGTPVFVLVAHSQRLQQLAPNELTLYAQQQLPENVRLVDRPTATADDAALASILFNIEQGEQIWRCLEQFVPGNGGLYLVTTCTSFVQFPRYQTDFEAILDSFQPLGS